MHFPEMPDITPTEWKVTIGTLVAILSSFGFSLTDAQQAALITTLTSVWAAFQLISNAWIRNGRAKGIGAVLASQVPPLDQAPLPIPPPPPDYDPNMVTEGHDSNAEMDPATLANPGTPPGKPGKK